MMPGSREVAVSVVSWNSAQWLEECVASVFRHAGSCALDVVVADAGSTDGSVELVERAFPQVTLLQLPNHGFAFANNRVIETTRAPYVLLLNPDTKIVEGALSSLVEFCEQNPRIAIVGARQTGEAGELQYSIRRFPNALRSLCEALGSERWPITPRWAGERELDPSAYEAITLCDWTSGSFMFARREALESVGLLDEGFFLYCEEPDLCLRLRRRGWQVAHVPYVTVIHYGGGAWDWDARLKAQEALSRRRYMQVHYGRMHRAAGTVATAVGYALRALWGGHDRKAAPRRRAAARAELSALLGFGDPSLDPRR